ncbi:MAG: choice-of-anchor Q domain-containing protein [Rhodanobacteraceae bacterium]
MKSAIPVLACALLLSVLSLPVKATTRTWPGAAPCNTTLQACISASADGDYLNIASNGPIDEDLTVYETSLTLRAANGYHPEVAAGRRIWLNSSSSTGDLTMRLSGIRLRDGYVAVYYRGTGTANYDLRDLDASSIVVEADPGSVVNFTAYNNRIRGTSGGLNGGLLRLSNDGAELNAQLLFNRISTTESGWVDGSGILASVINGGTGTIAALGNTVHGSFSRAGIFVSEGLFASTTSNVVTRLYSNVVVCGGGSSVGRGIGLTVNNGSIDGQVINNTVTECYSGIDANQWNSGGSGAAISGQASNNVLLAGYGLFLTPSLTTSFSNDYNLINATHITNGGFALGSHTITAPAKLVSSGIPRLTAASPAVDAADNALLGLGLAFNNLPALDADGLRRFKGPGSPHADIGAYEYGDMSFMHTASSPSNSHISSIYNPITDGDSSLDIFATPNYDAGGAGASVSNNNPFGSWYSGGHWTLFNEATAVNVPSSAHFNVFVPGKGDGVFRHVASSGNINTWSTQLDDASVNDKSDRIVLVNQNYTAGPHYNAHPVGVYYFAFGGPGAWFVANLDKLASGGDIPVGAGFSIYAQQPSPNAFRVTQSSTGQILVLDHPLLNGTPCARFAVTRMLGSSAVSGNFDLEYFGGHWRIWSYTSPIPAGDQFNVVVDPGQVEACTDVIFADPFE